ncbi:MerR family transcriptional regulator [Rhizobium sp. 1399]|uniref:MerR family transcriptional regulator n=1 Tax=Rhizobium sp. 1399 TaxID=2817758 RepID=UPI0028666643|nr:MerR family transcriptional regulator [Rhizobium sp. 1399]MDR6667076.1 DNA-binding transcriptional MerR regulator [Rhizobium sp. 1399]
MLTIGELSKATGTNISTIRYYEQTGLLTHTERSQGNQRRYSEVEKDRLTFIRHARDLGLTIEAIRDLIDLSERTDLPGVDATRIASEQLIAIRGKIERLQKLESELARISSINESRDKAYGVIRALADQ